MSFNPQDSQQEPVNLDQAAGAPKNDKEYNFAQVRKQLEQERNGRLKAEQEAAELKARMAPKPSSNDEEDSYDEPYIDKRYFNKKMSQNMQQMQEEADKRAEQKMRNMFVEEKRNSWLKSNPDFQEVMQHAQKFAETDPELAETILEMPEGFERQKLVYKNIKALGLHKPAAPKETIQDRVDKNRKGPYYQPSQQGAAPYGSSGDFSQAGQKNAYDQMKALQNRLRLG